MKTINNKNLLMISYIYPPIGGSGTQRSLKFSKYLSKLGWNISILTVDKDNNMIHDHSLINEIPNDINIYRANHISPYNLIKRTNNLSNIKNKTNQTSFKTAILKIINFCLNLILIPDRQILWFPWAYSRAKKIIKNNNIKIIYSTFPPGTNHILAYLIAKKFKLPLIIDFRDEWYDNPLHYSILNLLNKLIKKIESKVITYAKIVITATPTWTNSLKKKYDHSKFHTIENGYDEDDFIDKFHVGNDKFTISHVGSIYSGDSADNFLIAIDRLIQDKKINTGQIKLNLIGAIGNTEFNNIPNSIIGILNMPGSVNHKRSIQFLLESDLLLLYMSNQRGLGCQTGKIFEYLRANKPILALVPTGGEAAKVIKETKAGTVINPDNINDIEKSIYGYFKLWNSNTLKSTTDMNTIKKYKRSNQAKILSELMLNII